MAKKKVSPNTEVVQSAETEVVEGTTDRLFGEEVAPEGVTEPKAVVEGQEATAPVEPVTNPTETAPQYLNLEDLSGQKVKTKVDGVDGEVTIEELLKSYQTNETISQRGQELGSQRQAIAGERKELDELRAKVEGMVGQGQVAQPQGSSLPTDFDLLDDVTKQALLAQDARNNQRMTEITTTMQNLTASLQPLQVEQEFKSIDGILKSVRNPQGESIYTDFMDKITEVDTVIMSLPVERQAEFMTPLGYMNIYKDIKAKESSVVNTGTPLEPALIPRIEGGVATPTGGNGETSQRADLRKKAMDASALKDIREGKQADPLAAWGALVNYDSQG